MATKRNYRKEYAEYQGQPKQIANRVERNKARSIEVKAGKVSKGDGMDVDHIKPIVKGGKTIPSNLRIKTASANRSYPRNSKAGMK